MASVQTAAGGSFTVPCRFKFSGTAWSLFNQLVGGLIACMFTLGIYFPWLVCRMQRWTSENISLNDSQGNQVNTRFNGIGSELFATTVLGLLLTVVTLGIYGPWFVVSMIKFFVEKTEGETSDGQKVSMAFTGTGGGLFQNTFVGMILMTVTLGLYTPWFMCRNIRWFYDHLEIDAGQGNPITLEFKGTGGEMLKMFIVSCILTICTLGIYCFWFQVKVWKFQHDNTEVVTPSGNRLAVRFTGTGDQFAGIMIIGMILNCLTLGIYQFRFMVRQIQFQTDHIEIGGAELGGAELVAAGPAA